MSDQLRENLRQYENVSVSYAFTAADNYSAGNGTTKIADKTGYTTYIVQITIAVTTDNAATQVWQDNAGTPVPVAALKASPGLGPVVWDFGPDGFALTADKGLLHDMSGAGMAGAVSITAYRRKTINA